MEDYRNIYQTNYKKSYSLTIRAYSLGYYKPNKNLRLSKTSMSCD